MRWGRGRKGELLSWVVSFFGKKNGKTLPGKYEKSNLSQKDLLGVGSGLRNLLIHNSK